MMWNEGLEQLRLDKAIEEQRGKTLLDLLRMVQIRNYDLVGVSRNRLDRELEEIQHEKGERW